MNQDAVVDYLIVGQGLAGTLLGRAFERRGISFRIVEQENRYPLHALRRVWSIR